MTDKKTLMQQAYAADLLKSITKMLQEAAAVAPSPGMIVVEVPESVVEAEELLQAKVAKWLMSEIGLVVS